MTVQLMAVQLMAIQSRYCSKCGKVTPHKREWGGWYCIICA